MEHGKRWYSLVGWACSCGARWQNESLKGKTDLELELERDTEFEKHILDMHDKGFA